VVTGQLRLKDSTGRLSNILNLEFNLPAAPATFNGPIAALDASPAPGTNWGTDYTAKADRFGGMLNMPRLFFGPSQTLSWGTVNASMMTSLRDGEVPVVSKKLNITYAEARSFFDAMPARHPFLVFIFSHEYKLADMPMETFLARWAEVRRARDDSPNRDRIVLCLNFMAYQIDHNNFPWQTVLGTDPLSIWDIYSEDIYNEDWSTGSGGYETLENVLGGFQARTDHILSNFGMRSAIVEYGADLEAGGQTGQTKVYTDGWAWAKGHRRTGPTAAWSAQPAATPMLWVGFWADNAISPVWHDANSTSNPIQVFVREQIVASQGKAAPMLQVLY
jgi:hypothetical protein